MVLVWVNYIRYRLYYSITLLVNWTRSIASTGSTQVRHGLIDFSETTSRTMLERFLFASFFSLFLLRGTEWGDWGRTGGEITLQRSFKLPTKSLARLPRDCYMQSLRLTTCHCHCHCECN